MKQYPIAAAMLAAAFCATAKEQHGRNQLSHTITKEKAAKTATAAERLIAYSYRHLASPTTLIDTSHYYYSGTRGSWAVDWDKVNVPTLSYITDLNIKCDSFFYILGEKISGRISYNTSDEPTVYKHYDTSGSGTDTYLLTRIDELTYDPGDRISVDTIMFPLSLNNDQDYTFYNVSGQLIEDSVYSTEVFLPAAKTMYTYDGSGNNIQWDYYIWSTGTGGWLHYEQCTNTFDAFNHRIKSLVTSYATGAWENTQKDTLYYPTSGDRYTYSASFTWNNTTSAWTGTGAQSYSVNSMNQWDTIVLYSWNGTTKQFDTTEKDYQTYDSYGNLRYAGGIMYNLTTHSYAAAAYDLNTLYYEPTDITTAVAAPGAPGVGIHMFPNPVAHTLTIKPENMGPDEMLSVTVINIMGQTVTSYKANGQTTGSIDMSGYPAGIYIVAVQNESGSFQHKEQIVKN